MSKQNIEGFVLKNSGSLEIKPTARFASSEKNIGSPDLFLRIFCIFVAGFIFFTSSDTLANSNFPLSTLASPIYPVADSHGATDKKLNPLHIAGACSSLDCPQIALLKPVFPDRQGRFKDFKDEYIDSEEKPKGLDEPQLPQESGKHLKKKTGSDHLLFYPYISQEFGAASSFLFFSADAEEIGLFFYCTPGDPAADIISPCFESQFQPDIPKDFTFLPISATASGLSSFFSDEQVPHFEKLNLLNYRTAAIRNILIKSFSPLQEDPVISEEPHVDDSESDSSGSAAADGPPATDESAAQAEAQEPANATDRQKFLTEPRQDSSDSAAVGGPPSTDGSMALVEPSAPADTPATDSSQLEKEKPEITTDRQKSLPEPELDSSDPAAVGAPATDGSAAQAKPQMPVDTRATDSSLLEKEEPEYTTDRQKSPPGPEQDSSDSAAVDGPSGTDGSVALDEPDVPADTPASNSSQLESPDFREDLSKNTALIFPLPSEESLQTTLKSGEQNQLKIISLLPDFAVPGDTFEAMFKISTDAAVEEIQVEIFAGQAEEKNRFFFDSIKLDEQNASTISFPLRIEENYDLKFFIKTRFNGQLYNTEYVLPVVAPRQDYNFLATGRLKKNEIQGLKFIPAEVDLLEVATSRQPVSIVPFLLRSSPGGSNDSLDSLAGNIFLRFVRLEQGVLFGLTPDKNDKETIITLISRLEKFQNSDGGYSLFPEYASDFYLTAYLLLLHQQLGNSGFKFEAETTDKATVFLIDKLEKMKNSGDNPSLEICAFALWVLSNTRQSMALEYFYRVYNQVMAEPKLNPMASACLLLATMNLPELTKKEERVRTLVSLLNKQAVARPTRLYFPSRNVSEHHQSLGSQIRDNAVVLLALTQAVENYPRLDTLAFWLNAELGTKKDCSDQELVFALMAFSAYAAEMPTSTSVLNISLGTQNRITAFLDLPAPVKVLDFKIPENSLAREQKFLLLAEKGTSYYTAYSKSAETHAPQTSDGILELERSFTPNRIWKESEPVQMHISLRAREDLFNVLLFVPFAGGVQPVFETEPIASPDFRAVNVTSPTGRFYFAQRLPKGVYNFSCRLQAMARGKYNFIPAYAKEIHSPAVSSVTNILQQEIQ